MNVNKHVKVLEQLRADGFGFDFGYELEDEQHAALDAAIAALKALGAQSAQKGVVAWARPVYARPVSAPDTGEWDELVDIEFHTRPEKPEGEGWCPLVVADTGDGVRVTEALENTQSRRYGRARTLPVDDFVATFRCKDKGIVGTRSAKIHSVIQHADGVIEVVIDHWPQP